MLWSWFSCGSLDDLAAERVDPNSSRGWLYCPTGNGFALGYIYWIDRGGYSLYAYTSESGTWEAFHPSSSGPFIIGPTQTPTSFSNPPLPTPSPTPLLP